MNAERLTEIEALASNTRPPPWGTVPDLCQALREARETEKVRANREQIITREWIRERDALQKEIERVKALAVRLGNATDEVLLSSGTWARVEREDVQLLSGASLTTEEWRSLGEDRR